LSEGKVVRGCSGSLGKNGGKDTGTDEKYRIDLMRLSHMGADAISLSVAGSGLREKRSKEGLKKASLNSQKGQGHLGLDDLILQRSDGQP